MKDTKLPPGQRALSSFPRFGVTFGEAPPRMAGLASIRITGAVARVSDIPVARLAELERTDRVADFHCVTGWSAHELAWQGVAFRTFYQHVIVGGAGVHPDVSHIRFHGADGYAAVLLLADAVDETVLLADRLGGAPLSAGHGALVRLVSPKQYG
ncbi:MAG: molybdopterin-dependent oxidoreductase, partial [Salinisphaera sp.]|nr:molybdopterin-dependent oxidoreductase [Salinisphaera sp.]